MPTSAAVIMICACIIIFVLLGIAVILTIDIYRRLDTFEELDRQVKKAIKTVVELNKLKNELEEEVFKYKLLRETKEERKHEILDNSYNTNVIHSDRGTINSSTNNSNTTDSNIYSKSDCENNQ